MKTKYITFFCWLLLSANAQNIYFPDANLKSKLVLASPQNQTANSINVVGNSKIDLNNNGEIEQNEALLITVLNLAFSNIVDLTGINFFTNLKGLGLYSNQLTSININSLINLESLDFRYNGVSSVDFSNCPTLRDIGCSYNQLTSLDFSNNPQFKELICSNNNLTSINIKNGSFQNINLPFPQSSNDCWKVGNPNLTTICADENEVAPLTTFLASCNSGANPTIDSSCVLANEKFTKNEFMVYPNPASSTINVNINSNGNGKINLELLDIQGRVLQSKNVSNSQTSLDISGLVKGVYFLKVNAGNRTQIERIIKE